jgi:predicted HicB family RNase H-like nuclease
VSREAAAAFSRAEIAAAASRLSIIFLPFSRGLTPTAMCGHRFAIPEMRNYFDRHHCPNSVSPCVALQMIAYMLSFNRAETIPPRDQATQKNTIMAKTKKQPKGKSASKPQEALKFAQDKAKTCQTWMELSNAMYGIGGKFSELFPTQSERVQFTKSEEYAQVQDLIGSLPGPGSSLDGEVSGANGTMIVRGPKSLHAALLAEAKAEGVSLNQLCIAKLSLQLRAQI